MKRFQEVRVLFIAAALLAASALATNADDNKKSQTVYPVAILPFQERGGEVKTLGGKVTDLVFAELVAKPELYLVDREDLQKQLAEQELSLSGLVDPAAANKVGQLTGAKVLIVGSVFQVDADLHVVAKVIGTETSRVLGASAKGSVRDPLDGLAKQLAAEVAKTITDRADELVAKRVTREDRLAALKQKLGKGQRPAVLIQVSERHIGQGAIDPAAETELAWLCKELGFDVIDSSAGNRKQADLTLSGEGFSELAGRHGNLVSVKSRLEIKAIDRASGRVLAADRQTTVAVDVAEQIAGKSALQEAAAQLAERVLPKLAKADSDKPVKERK